MKKVSAHIVDSRKLEDRLLALSDSRSFFAFYTSRGYGNSHKKYELLFALDALDTYDADDLAAGAFESGWKFGYLGYELRHRFEKLDAGNPKLGHWPEALFFTPRIVGTLDLEGNLEIHAPSLSEAREYLEKITQNAEPLKTSGSTKLDFRPIESKEEYLSAIAHLQGHIQRGDIYEINYCTGFVASVKDLDKVGLFKKLVAATDAPFSAFLKLGEHTVLCSSPERYIQKEGKTIRSQPIKGTNRRSDSNNEEAQRALLESEKERAENVMIVDLVRNDLSHVAAKGSVRVSELFGTYAFKNVNQMISTVEAELRDELGNWDIIKASFPMGSMTGAPKISAMQLSERYEKSAREIYSGAIGYVDPAGDFDLNVVIRSIAINDTLEQATLHVGGAITILSDPEAEYSECLLKAESLINSSR